VLRLQKEKATIHKFGDRTYYVFPAPPTHTNYVNRPTKYADEGALRDYAGRGSNRSARLLPEVHSAVNDLMTSLLDYGDELGDQSIQSAVIQNGWRPPDDPSQGVHYLENITMVINNPQFGFSSLTFPESLEAEAESFLGETDDPRWQAFVRHLSESPGWDAATARRLLDTVAQYYVPRGGFNPHATGLVFDLNFSIYHHVRSKDQKALIEAEDPVGAHPVLNQAALRSAVGMWLNSYSMQYNFDSYNTGKEIWHMEWRNWKDSKPKTT
jgi:hypothetical protein